MRNNEYAQRKYTLGEGANRRKKVRAAWPQNENYPAEYLGWTPVSSHVRAAEHHLFSSLRIASSLVSRAGTGTPTTSVFLFDKTILLEAIFTVSAHETSFSS